MPDEARKRGKRGGKKKLLTHDQRAAAARAAVAGEAASGSDHAPGQADRVFEPWSEA